MSGKLRRDKICLNCTSFVSLRYCSNCGQENIEPQENFGSIVKHFIADVFHFDGKFFETVKYLFTRPGFLSAEYSSGKRTRYFHPIRMYLFTSAIFFFLFFWLFAPKADADFLLTNENRDLLSAIFDKFIHRLPYLLFVSLPVNTFYLLLLYRREKQFYYSDHAVFLIHLYIFTFIALLLFMATNKLFFHLGTTFLAIIYFMFSGFAAGYAYKAMLRFYGQGKIKTLFKFLLFNAIAFASLMILFGLFLLVTFLQA